MFDARTLKKIEVAAGAKSRSILLDILKFTLVALLILAPFRMFVAQPFIVSGSSMDPTFLPNEYLVIDQATYRFHEPKRGEVVIFRYPLDPDTFFIKRIVAMPLETIDVTDGVVTVTGVDGTKHILEEPYLNPESKKKESVVTSMEKDEYFVLGDNRKASSDSRIWGPLPKKFIIGRALMRLLPLSKISTLPGEYKLHL